MTSPPPSRRRAGALALLIAVLVLLGPPAAAPAAPAAPAGPGPSIELVTQTPVVGAGGTFTADVLLTGIPADGAVELVLHQRVRSRSELALSRSGEGLRTAAFNTVMTISSLAAQPDGSRRVTLSLDPAAGGVQLQIEGVYPIELIAQDAADTELARLTTHLVMGPEQGDDAPPLAVAVVAEVVAPVGLQPDGSVVLDRDDVADLAGMIAGLAAAPDVPVNLAIRPETVDSLAASTEPGDAELVAALRDAAAGRTALIVPYADVSPDDLAPAGLIDELQLQRFIGQQVLSDALGIETFDGSWMASADLGVDGMAALGSVGVGRVVVEDTQVAPIEPGILSLSLAQPFLLAPPPDSTATLEPLQAMALDPVVTALLDEDESDGLLASRVLSELALLRLEQPSVPRSVVLPLPAGLPAGVVQLVLEGLSAGRPFEPTGLAEAFDHAGPLVDGGGNAVERALIPASSTPIRAQEGMRLQSARAAIATFGGLVGADSPRIAPLTRHLLVAAAEGLTATQRRAHLDTLDDSIAEVTSGVSTPDTFTLTLTARDGTVPLTIRNDSGEDLRVTVRLRSQKLEFPEGDTISQVLTEETTRIDISVRALASGVFPLEVDVTTPDGRMSLTTTRYTVRSTAVPGVGLVLSGGAGIFLVVWWARHWRRTRRSAKLVAVDDHPSAR